MNVFGVEHFDPRLVGDSIDQRAVVVSLQGQKGVVFRVEPLP